MNADAKTEIKGKERYKAGVLKYAQMGYWNGDYESRRTPTSSRCSGLRHRRGSTRSRRPLPLPVKARQPPGRLSGPIA
ncbi:hypothetical protein ABIA23_006389 [Sinorhizobium fredii]